MFKTYQILWYRIIKNEGIGGVYEVGNMAVTVDSYYWAASTDFNREGKIGSHMAGINEYLLPALTNTRTTSWRVLPYLIQYTVYTHGL